MPAKKTESALAVMAERMSLEPKKLHETLTATVFKGATAEELVTLVVVANEHNLNPLQKEIYAFKGRGGGIVPVISVDGWIKIMNSHPKFDGVQFHTEVDEKGKPISCTCSIFTKGRENPTVITEYFSECVRPTDTWKQYPFRMLRWKALSQGVRTAFGFAGYSDSEEEPAAVIEAEKPVFDNEEDYPNLFGDDSPPGAEVSETERELLAEG
ncbi:MAG: recombinase RecT [Akkermansiaceae bacterium]